MGESGHYYLGLTISGVVERRELKVGGAGGLPTLQVGDVLLLEIQKGLLPTETDVADLDAIRLAVALGIAVVEAAGNGSFDPDSYTNGEKCPRCCELVITSDDPETPVKTFDVMAYPIWSDCGCKNCDDCRKGCCGKHHDESCIAQGIDACCDDESHDHEMMTMTKADGNSG